MKYESSNGICNDGVMKTAGWFLAGIAIGGGAALLMAPRSGRETRAKLLRDVEDGSTKTREGADYVYARSQELASDVGSYVDAGKERVRQEGRNIGAAIDAGIDAGKQAYQKAATTIDAGIDAGKQAYQKGGAAIDAGIDAGKQAYQKRTPVSV